MKKFKQLVGELPSKTVVFTFGRFNPPTVGHELLIKVVRKISAQTKADHIIFASSAHDAKKNPLDPNKKIQYLELMFPNTRFVASNTETRTFINAAAQLNKKYKNLIMVVGSDRVQEFKKLLEQYNGKAYKFEKIQVISAGERDPDSDDVTGVSASKMRTFATKGDYLQFKRGLPTTVRDIDGKRLMNDIRCGMGLEPIKEQINLVKDELREQYFRGEIFNEGDIVESDNTVYKIIKRGSNHLLLQNESGAKVSKWIKDVHLTERGFMSQVNEALSADDKSGAREAENVRKMAELKAQQAKQIEDVKERQAREVDQAKSAMQRKMAESVASTEVNTHSKYNVAKSIMRLSDFRKTMAMGQKPIKVDNDKETESDIDASAHAVHAPAHTQVGGHQMNTDGNQSLRRMKANYHLEEVEVDEEFKDVDENQFYSDLDTLTEEDFLEAYDDEELAIIDEETGEELEAVAEEAEFDTEVIMEVLSRQERIKAKARLRRTQAKRVRNEKIAIRRFSTPEVANRRARRMAVAVIKKRLLSGRKPNKVSIGEKERAERYLAQRRKVVDRLAARMVSKVRQVEKARLSHKKFTK